MITTSTAPTSSVTKALARDRLGVAAVVFFVMSGIAPLTVTAGVVPTAYAVTGLIAIPAAFLAVALVLGVFSSGYVAMARHVRNAGAFYAFIARGLGGPVGVGAAMVALLSYCFLEVGLYGAFGPGAAQYAADHLHLQAPWWLWATTAWLLVAVLGGLRVEVTGRVLAVLLSLEVLVTLALTVSGLTRPADHHLSFGTLAPTGLLTGGVGAVLAVAVLGFVGFEGAAVLTEEAKNPRRTVAVATYLALGLIAVVYAAASWAMAVHYGNGQVVSVAREQGPAMMFDLGGHLLGVAGQTFYLTSLFAATIAFHSFFGRYLFVLGREGVLPRVLASTSRTGAPAAASLTQSVIGLAVIAVYAVMGWDPLTKLFFWLGTTGGFGILLLIALTSIAVIAFFIKQATDESLWHRLIAPLLAAVALLGMVWLVLHNYATLLGVPPGSAAARWLPATFAIVGVGGVLWGLWLRRRDDVSYQAIGDSRARPSIFDSPIATPDPVFRDIEI
jgi:amino acid transporter